MMKVMIVDDSTKMREMIKLFIHSSGDEIIECSDGAAAVSSFEQFQPDVVLMDIEMKPMDGFEATERIHQFDPAARIIFVSSYNTSVFRAKAKMMNAAGFVSKENLSELNTLLLQ